MYAQQWDYWVVQVQVQSLSPAQLFATPWFARSTPGLPVHHHLPEFTQTCVHRVSDAIQPSQPRSSPSPPAPNPSQHQSLFQWVNSSHEVASFLRNLHTVLHDGCTILHSYRQCKSIPFSSHPPAFIVIDFDDGHSDQCEMIPHCGFDLHLCNNEWCWASFHVFISHVYVFFGEMSYYVFCPLFVWLNCSFFWYWATWAACIFWKLILCQFFHLLLLSPILWTVWEKWILSSNNN